jgi:DNA invertase Pin-like site-specific DNA recombinase
MTASRTSLSPSPRDASSSTDRQGRRAEVSAPPRSAKIQGWHLDRLAIVYVRQSTPQQVSTNTESTARQYALVQRAAELGWPASRVLVIDEDQGRSGATVEGRFGFQRLLAEVGLDHVGLILGLEMSRLARSCRDWHQLLELCAIFRTLLADQDGVYDPTDYNDRLLLGLTGIMSEAELHVLQRRMHEGRRNKARRGELFILAPTGYVKLPTGEFALDPDEQVQGVVRLVFDQFERLGTVRKVHRYFLEQGIRLGFRLYAGPNRGQLEWRTPRKDTLAQILRHPLYAGYYCYGRRRSDARRKKAGQPGSGRVAVPREEYIALLPDRCPAYISKERHEAIQRQLAQNRARAESKGAPREGPALLAGLVRCAHCNKRMVVHYAGRRRTPHYLCRSEAVVCGADRRSLAGPALEALVAEQVLAALQPGALELSLAAMDDVLRLRQHLDTNWRQRLERARYRAQRAERQYHAVEPENRLVARSLEQQWEEALQEVRRLEEDYDRARRQQPATLTAREVGQLRALAADLPALWQAPSTTAADRKQIIRFLVESVVVAVEKRSNQVEVTLTWVGGQTSAHELVRPVLRYEQAANFDGLVARIKELRALGLSCRGVAERLNAEGYRPLRKGERFQGRIVWWILRRRSPGAASRAARWRGVLQKGEWLVVELAAKLGIPKATLFAWIHRGWIHHRKPAGPGMPFVCWADADELRRLRQLRRTPHGWWDPPLPVELTTSKPRPPE